VETAFLAVCESQNPRGIRKQLINFPGIDSALIEDVLENKLADPKLSPESPMYLAWGLVALFPSSCESVRRILFRRSPANIFEVHFSIFNSLDRDDFNPLEQGGIETLLAEYLMNISSTAAFAAWEAGHIMGHEWYSPRTERALVDLIARARFPAGRLGAINGYSWIANHKENITRADLAPLNRAARYDPSERVRTQARFEIDRVKRSRSKDVSL
jgi:hypothetical protein